MNQMDEFRQNQNNILQNIYKYCYAKARNIGINLNYIKTKIKFCTEY